MTKEEERAVIDRVLAGETEQFEKLVKAHEKGVYNLALRMLGNEQDALDASQEAFFRAYRSLGRFRGDSRLSVWLYRVTGNVCLDMLRKAGRRRDIPLSGGEDGELELPDERFEPQRELEKKELRRSLRDNLLRLEPEFRQPLILRDVNGLTYRQIEQVMGLGPGTVKSRIFRARQKLAALLARDGNFFAAPASDPMGKRGGGSDA